MVSAIDGVPEDSACSRAAAFYVAPWWVIGAKIGMLILLQSGDFVNLLSHK